MAGAIAELGVPTQGAVAALPVPGTPVNPQQADAEAFRATAGPMRRGFRSGMNSVGAMLEGLAGQAGETLGLEEFAASRFKSAAEYTDMANSVAPAIRDTSQVNDLNSLVDYVSGHMGSGAATTLPVIAAGIGLRRPIAGVLGASTALESGEQVNTLRQDPTVMATQTPGTILANSLGKGAVAGVLELGGAGGQATKALLKGTTAGFGKNVAKGVAGEAVTEAGQDLTGQAFHQQLNPNKELDLEQTFQAGAAGAAGGGGIALATQLPGAAMATAKTGKELADRLRGPRAPRDPYGEPEGIENIKDPEDLITALEEQEQKGFEDLDTELAKNPEKYAKYKNWKDDGDLETEFIDTVMEDHAEKVDRPKTDKGIEDINKMLNDYSQKKYTKVETQGADTTLNRMGSDVLAGKTIHYKGGDIKVSDFLAQNRYKEESPGVWSPTKKFSKMTSEADLAFHDFVMERIKDKTKARANPKAMMLLSSRLKDLALEPRAMEKAELPAGLRNIIGDRFDEIMDEAIDKFHSSDDTKLEARQILSDVGQRTKGAVAGRMNAVKALIRTNLLDKFNVDKDLREGAMGPMSRRMVDYIEGTGVDPEFEADMEYAFGLEKKEHVMEQLDELIRKNKQGQYEQDGQERSIDDRLGVPMSDEKALETFSELKDEFGDKAANLRIVDLGKGKYSVETEDPDTVSITEASFPSIQESKKHNKSELVDGILTVRTDKHPGGVKVSLVKLTNMMIRKEGQQTKEGGAKYVADMFFRGISALVSMPGFRGFTPKFENQLGGKPGESAWVFPDNTLVAKTANGTEYTFGEIKKYNKLTRGDLYGVTKEDVDAAEAQLELKHGEKAWWKNMTPQGRRVRAKDRAVKWAHDKEMLRDAGKDKMATPRGTASVVSKYADEDGKETTVYTDNTSMDVTRSEYETGKADKSGTRNEVVETEEINTVETDSGRVLPRSVRNDGDATIDDGMEFVDEQIKGEKEKPEARISQEETNLPLVGEAAKGPKGPTQGTVLLSEYYANQQRKGNAKKDYSQHVIVPEPLKFVSQSEFDKNEKRPKNHKDKKDYSKHRVVADDRAKAALDTPPRGGDKVIPEKVLPEPKTKESIAHVNKGPEIPANRTALAKAEEAISKEFEEVKKRIAKGIPEPVAPKDLEARIAALKKSIDKQTKDTGKIRRADVEEMLRLKSFGTKKFSNMNIGKGPITAEQKKEVKDYIERVLGKKNVEVLFRKLKNHSGSFEFLDPVEQIKIAIDAIDPMSVGYHEALHAFFARLVKADRKAANTLLRAAGSAPIMARLRELLKDHPDALDQLKDPEERLAYMYQFWAAKQLHFGVGPETQGLFAKIKAFFRKLSAIWSDEIVENMAVEEAGEILAAFHNGDFADRSTVAQVLHTRFPKSPLETAAEIAPGLTKIMNKFVWTAAGAVRDMNLPPLTKIIDQFHTVNGNELEDSGVGYLQAKPAEFHKRLNKVVTALEGLDEVGMKKVLDEMRSGEDRTSKAAQDLELILKEAFKYMNVAGVKIFKKNLDGSIKRKENGDPVYVDLKEISKNYFPRVPDAEYIRNNKEAFLTLLRKHKIKDADGVYEKYTKDLEMGDPKEEDFLIGLTYYTPAANERTMGNIPDAELAPFLSQDLFGTMAQYLGRATRRAEYTRRFGNSGEVIRDAVESARTQGMTKAQELSFSESIRAMEGSLGGNMSSELRALYGGLMTYQNIRLLPLALFSSLIDPLGIAVRGGTFQEAGAAFIRGIKDLVKLAKDDKYDLAKTIGAIDAATASHFVSDMYGSQYMPKTQRWLNEKFFKYNGMEGWNRSMRISAAAAAEQFIIRHATEPNEHSDRYMKELGLTKDDVQIVNDKLVLSPKIERALNLWVDQAIIRPNSANRPIYMSDPNWMLISHLKQYSYMFQKVIIARVHNEMLHGNLAPMATALTYVPVIIASDMLRAMLTPGGGDDDRLANFTMMDWLWRGLQRAGLFGPSQMVLDAGADLSMNKVGIESLAGPTVQQLIDFARGTATGNMDTQLLKAVPGNRIFS